MTTTMLDYTINKLSSHTGAEARGISRRRGTSEAMKRRIAGLKGVHVYQKGRGHRSGHQAVGKSAPRCS